MKSLFLFIVLFVGSLAFPSEELLELQWNNFKTIHQKSYNGLEEWQRKSIFQNNIKKIEEHNKLYEQKKVTYKMGINQFADMTSVEFFQFLNRQEQARIKPIIKNQLPLTSDVPDQIDWNEKGAVTEVQNQGQCGSPWIFSVTGTLEGANFVKNGVLIPLSQQELIDCASDNGCSGGFIETGFEYVLHSGLSAEKDYPYEDVAGTCRRDDIPSAVTETDYVLLPEGNEDRLKDAVGTTGPVAVEVNASNGWQFYSSGILYDEECSATNLNHAVLVAGYGAEDGTEFWLVKNSWGTTWGENGYIRTARNRDNNCGIASHAIYPIVA